MPNERKEKIIYLIYFNRVCGFELFVNLAEKLEHREPYSREGKRGKSKHEINTETCNNLLLCASGILAAL